MAGQARNIQTERSNIPSTEQAVDMNLDLDDALLTMAEVNDSDDSEETKPVIFSKSTDVRRRLEEKLEVKLLKDQLGMDDFDI